MMEYYGNSNLKMLINEHIKNNKLIHPNLIYNIALDLCLGLKEIHKKKIVHRNLMPHNLFINDDYRIKISNFLNSKEFNTIIKQSKESINYMALELINSKNDYNFKNDI